jgi:pimeloyl-ACP methyl ester carboxylesterase
VASLFVATHDPGGDAATVVLVHGSLDRSSAFARVQRHLEDLRVLRYDRRGYGRSLAMGPAASFAAQVTDLETVIGGRPAVVVGHSLGGVIALALAERRPDLVRAVVAYESPMAWTSWWPASTAGSVALARPHDPADAAERFMRRMIGDERWERLPRRTKDQRRAEGPALVADIASIRHPDAPPYEPEQLRVPVIAAHGTMSSPHHRRTAEVLAERAPGAELAVIEGAGHGVHLTHPAELAALARRGLERALAATA